MALNPQIPALSHPVVTPHVIVEVIKEFRGRKDFGA
jgi:hypothetical protein